MDGYGWFFRGIIVYFVWNILYCVSGELYISYYE